MYKSQSAGNLYLGKRSRMGASEITRNKNKIKTNLKHRKPESEDFGYYLAGLIDGDGHISRSNRQNQIVITFSSKDVQLAHYLKSKLKCGNVRKIKDKNAYNYIISNQQGILEVFKLINNKLRTESKIARIKDVLSYSYSSNLLSSTLFKGDFNGDLSTNLDN
jgi:hypothetical protein